MFETQYEKETGHSVFTPGRDGGEYYSAEYVMWLIEQIRIARENTIIAAAKAADRWGRECQDPCSSPSDWILKMEIA